MLRNIWIIILTLFVSNNAFASNFTNAIEKKDWQGANKIASKDERILVKWLKLIIEEDQDFYELTSFIKDNPSWPRQDYLKTKAEAAALNSAKNADALNWFKENTPRSLKAKLKYISLIQDPLIKQDYIRKVWSESSFEKLEEEEFLMNYQAYLKQDDHIKRINILLYQAYYEQAKRMLKLIPAASRRLYQLRLAMHDGEKRDLTHQDKMDIGVLHSLVHHFDREKDDDNLAQTLAIAATKDKSVQSYFWGFKARLIRAQIMLKQYELAYLLASSHGAMGDKEYSEGEWLAGWIALRFLNNPNVAITHFDNVYNRVKMPISISRAAYWLARSYEQLKNKEKSEYWYSIAAKHYTSFYGQLALCKINKCKVDLTKEYKISTIALQQFRNNPLVNSALILEKTKYNYLTKEFLLRAIQHSDSAEEIALILKIKFKNNHHHLATEISKHAGYKGVIVLGSAYPTPRFVYAGHNLEHALVLSLIRQESVFNGDAVSSAGAMGLMQLMPHVAKKTAKDMKLKYNQNKLLNDPHFNTKLGSSHIGLLLKKYDGSYILSIAAYNAGSKAVNKWIEDNGDPRLMKNEEDVIDWMEKITFHETRNYVQRVLENRAIYHCLINKKHILPKF